MAPLSFALLLAHAAALFVDNLVAKTNVTGAIMDAHDGTYNQWEEGGGWYFYAMGYGLCKQGQDLCHGCGYGYSWIGVWRSTDLSDGSWELVRDARDDTWPRWGRGGTYFRVHVVKNPLTGLYVLWVNADGAPECPAGNSRSCWLVGTATDPEGPFTYRGASGSRYPDGGDFDILVDDDGAGYVIYTSTTQGHKMSVERLSDDFLHSTYSPAPPTPPAPATGFSLLGNGACRDSAGVEPQFYTNEGSSLKPMSEADCAAACLADDACTAFSWCSGDGAGKSCEGACHAYVTSLSSPKGDGWSLRFKGQGDATAISRVTTGEAWWQCQSKESIAKLTRAADGPTATSSGYFGNEFVEAPALFKRKGTYYALFGKCCCFCGHGSGIGVYTAAHPLGPWTYHLNIGCGADEPTPGCGCGMNNGACSSGYGKSLTKAQQNFVFPLQTPTGTEYIWTGDRWQSSSDGFKAHDLQYWTPLTWAHDEASGLDLPQRLVWIDNFTIATVNVESARPSLEV